MAVFPFYSRFISSVFLLYISSVYRVYIVSIIVYIYKKKFLNYSTRNKQKRGLGISISRKIDTLYLIFENFTMSSKIAISTIGMQTKRKTND